VRVLLLGKWDCVFLLAAFFSLAADASSSSKETETLVRLAEGKVVVNGVVLEGESPQAVNYVVISSHREVLNYGYDPDITVKKLWQKKWNPAKAILEEEEAKKESDLKKAEAEDRDVFVDKRTLPEYTAVVEKIKEALFSNKVYSPKEEKK
jgi:type II secretory pathway component PulC